MKRLLSRLFWGGIQIAIVWFSIQAAYDDAARTGKPVALGLAIFVGIGTAIAFTVVCALITDGLKKIWWSLTRRNQPDISEPSSEQERLGTTQVNGSKTLELPRSAWVRNEPR